MVVTMMNLQSFWPCMIVVQIDQNIPARIGGGHAKKKQDPRAPPKYDCGSILFFVPISSPVFLVLQCDDYDDNDCYDNDGSPVRLALYVRTRSEPKTAYESWRTSPSKPRPKRTTPMCWSV